MLHQAANDGFRGLFLVCFDGPSAANGPRGLVVLSNGDNDAMLFNCAMARAMPARSGPPNQDFSRQPKHASTWASTLAPSFRQARWHLGGLRCLVLHF